jgi:hypothetical protein
VKEFIMKFAKFIGSLALLASVAGGIPTTMAKTVAPHGPP